MTVSILRTHDAYIQGLVEHICTKISTKFPGASFEICAHPVQRGAIIDAYVPTEDDFEVLDLVNPELDGLLLTEDIAIYVRALGPSSEGSGRRIGNSNAILPALHRRRQSCWHPDTHGSSEVDGLL